MSEIRVLLDTVSNGGHALRDEKQRPVAVMLYGGPEKLFRTCEEQKRLAILFAAAPYLLAALESITGNDAAVAALTIDQAKMVGYAIGRARGEG